MSAKVHAKPKRPGGERRGNSYAKRARKIDLLATYGGTCVHCSAIVDYDTMEVDKVVPHADGPGYVWDNVHSSCKPCNRTRSDNTTPEEIASLQSKIQIRVRGIR